MTESGPRKSWKELVEENRLLLEEVQVSRKAADITAKLVIEQFVKSDEFVRMLQEKFEIEKKTKNFLAALHKTTLGLMSRLDLESLLKNLVVRATQLSNTPHGFIYLLNREKTYLKCKVGIGLFQKTIDLKLQQGEGMAGDIWKTGQPLCIADYDTWPGRSPRIEYNVFQSIIGVPLVSGGKFRGVLGMATDTKTDWTFQKDDVTMLTRFAELASIAIDNARLYSEAQEAQQVAEEANQSKSDFLAKMSHEIRTPMNAIIGMAGLARKQELTPKLRNYLDIIQTSAHSLLNLINDILDFSKIEAGKLEFESTDFHLRSVMEHLSDLFSQKAAQKNIELIISIKDDVPCALVGDPHRLGQVLTNLTNNAVKFTESGDILITVSCSAKRDDRVILKFSISDTGIGLSEEEIDRLFSAFSQADTSTTRKYGGTGLGLAISKGLVETMGGRIWVDSQPGKGSTFQFEAEFTRQPAEEEMQLVLPEKLGALHALVIDDNQTSRIIIAEMLKSFHFHTDVAVSGEEALDLAKKRAQAGTPYDLALMDWKMPGMDGISTAEVMKADADLKATRIIMMTAFGREQEMRKAEQIGIEAFLFKPIKESLLFDTIMELFGQARLADSRRAQRTSMDASLDTRGLAGHAVLVVEDNLINQQVATEILQGVGIQVTIANNGREAVECVSQAIYDAVLMDIQMPEMDGLEATQAIRKDPRFQELPIIAMTADAMTGDREKCLAVGMNDYLSKPIDTARLFSSLLQWIKPRPFATLEDIQPTPEPSAETLSIDGIDMSEAVNRLGGNSSLLLRLINDFVRDYAQATEQIQQAIQEDDLESGQRLAHTLKGVAGNLSAKALFEAARATEEAFKASQPADAPLNELAQELKRIVNSVQTLSGADSQASNRDPSENVAATETDIAAITETIQLLSEHLKNNDLEAEDVLTSLTGQLPHQRYEPLIRQLKKQVSDFEFEAASRTLENLQKSLGIQGASQS